jgi:hypothetical protein
MEYIFVTDMASIACRRWALMHHLNSWRRPQPQKMPEGGVGTALSYWLCLLRTDCKAQAAAVTAYPSGKAHPASRSRSYYLSSQTRLARWARLTRYSLCICGMECVNIIGHTLRVCRLIEEDMRVHTPVQLVLL